MKKVSLVIIVLFLFSVAARSADLKDKKCKTHSHWSHVEFNMDGSSILISYEKDSHEVVEITGDYQLIVNHEPVRLDRGQKKLVKAFHENTRQLIREAEKIGWEGARLGIHGATLGAEAISGLLSAVLTDYDMDDFERDMEEKASKLEAKADKLEEKADKLEELSDKVEDLHDDMVDNIPELRRLEWF